MSLDGFICGPNGETDWITPDPEVDFAALWAQFDTGIMGRKTYEVATKRLGEKAFAGVKMIVFSRTMRPEDHPGITVVPELTAEYVELLKRKRGKDIWLFGGGELFRAFLNFGLVDTVEVNIIPVLLGAGIPLLPPPYTPTILTLRSHKVYLSGRVSVEYQVLRQS